MSDKVITNAADEKQAKAAKERVENAEQRYRRAMQQVLSTEDGRIVLWDLLGFCRTFASVWEPGAKMGYNAGQQDVGHYVMGKIVEADPAALLQMMAKNPR